MNTKVFLMAIIVFSVAAVVLALQSVRAPILDILIAIPLIFYLPGYTLTKAMFPGKTLSTSEQILFGLGLSLVLTIIGGLILNLTSAGLVRTSWVILLSSISLVAGIVALFREWKNPGKQEGSTERISFSLKSALLFLCAILITIGSLWFSNFEVSHQNPSPFTQLWALEDQNDWSIIHIGIQNEEKETFQYKLQILQGDKLIQEPVFVELQPQKKWEMTFQLTKVDAASKEDISVELYRLNQPETIYRHVLLRRVR